MESIQHKLLKHLVERLLLGKVNPPCSLLKAFLYLQSLDGAQRGKESFADGLQFVIIQRQQIEVLQVLEGVDS